MGSEAFAAFRRHVVGEPPLIAMLLPITDHAAFLDAAVVLGAARGFIFARTDADAALREAQFARLMQLMPQP